MSRHIQSLTLTLIKSAIGVSGYYKTAAMLDAAADSVQRLFNGASGGRETAGPPQPPARWWAAERARVPILASPEILYFRVSSPRIWPDQPAQLSWAVAGAEQVVISHGVGIVPVRGELRVNPAETTVYVLEASGPGGEAAESVRITVMGPGSRSLNPEFDPARPLHSRG